MAENARRPRDARRDSRAGAAEPVGPPSRMRFLHRGLENWKIGLGVVLLLVIMMAVAVGPVLAGYDPTATDLINRLQAPGWANEQRHLMGTDQLGRDITARVLEGGRLSLAVSASAVLLAMFVGVVAGLCAGLYGGRVDTVVMWLVDMQLAFPFILLALILVAALGNGVPNLVIVLSLASWVVYARTVRGEALSLRERDFVTAARSLGATNVRIVRRHLLPNVLPLIIVISMVQIGQIILIESSLSFLGVGLQPPFPSWGRDLFEGRRFIEVAWWVGAFPGLAILSTVIAVNVLGEGLRELVSR
ncbi:MAG: ABC transporter permease [Chloroflexota bacterium]